MAGGEQDGHKISLVPKYQPCHPEQVTAASHLKSFRTKPTLLSEQNYKPAEIRKHGILEPQGVPRSADTKAISV